ncbi:MAG: luciferase family protein [Nitrososphaeraceae archaeon]|jgi:hypothetical protein
MSSTIETIKKEILSWSGITCGPHSFGGIEYRLGKSEMGYVHQDTLADLPFSMQIRG